MKEVEKLKIDGEEVDLKEYAKQKDFNNLNEKVIDLENNSIAVTYDESTKTLNISSGGQ